MSKSSRVLSRVIFVFSIVLFLGSPLPAQGKDVSHIVLLGDPHLPGRNLPLKEKAIQTINSWEDVDRVVALGDICNDLGTQGEYGAAKKFFSSLKAPLSPIVGNHD